MGGRKGAATALYHPKVYKHRFCAFYNSGKCPRGDSCAFAHSREEIRTPVLAEEEQNQAPEAMTDDFVMHRFKTLWCPVGVPHDWHMCVYAHTYQDARRNPGIGYGSRPCPHWQREETTLDYAQRCPMGLRCPFSHGAKEQLYHPAYFKTKTCQDCARCPRTKFCAFWHDRSEERVPPAAEDEYNYKMPLPEGRVADALQPDFLTPLAFQAVEGGGGRRRAKVGASCGGRRGQEPSHQLGSPVAMPAAPAPYLAAACAGPMVPTVLLGTSPGPASVGEAVAAVARSLQRASQGQQEEWYPMPLLLPGVPDRSTASRQLAFQQRSQQAAEGEAAAARPAAPEAREDSAPTVALNLLSPSKPHVRRPTGELEVLRSPVACRSPPARDPREQGSVPDGSPASLRIRNTFLDMRPERSPSLERFFEERKVRSSPPSGPPSNAPSGPPSGRSSRACSPVRPLALDLTAVAAVSMKRFFPVNGDGVGLSSFIPTPTSSTAVSPREPPSGALDLPVVLRLSDSIVAQSKTAAHGVNAAAIRSGPAGLITATQLAKDIDGSRSATCSSATGSTTIGSATVPPSEASALGDATRTELDGRLPAVGTPELPSSGSALHAWGACRPCAFVFQEGCMSGADCQFCHLCDPGERKRRRKERRRTAMRQQSVVAAEPPAPLTFVPMPR